MKQAEDYDFTRGEVYPSNDVESYPLATAKSPKQHCLSWQYRYKRMTRRHFGALPAVASKRRVCSFDSALKRHGSAWPAACHLIATSAAITTPAASPARY